MSNLDGLISAPQAAELLGISVKTLYRNSYTYDDFPQPTRVGRTVLYDPDKLRAWRYDHPPRGHADTR
ncbi:putative DNA-binding transcriptional regulator AlpA [Actinopolyspora lacussalsi]|nr:putative DNA-binding transcriptional regulator AlpA [Actinopolyspora lacussalsi]